MFFISFRTLEVNRPQRFHDTHGIHWIDVPTFHPSKDQSKVLLQIIEKLLQLREQIVIFDLRGNGGGNSLWGETLLKAFFGKEYAEQRLAESSRDIYVEWRVSSENLEHVKGFIPMMKSEFEENYPAIKWAKNTYAGMEKAFSRGEYYYSELKTDEDCSPFPDAVNPVRGRVMVIVDAGCGSACLDFIDGLKSMKADLVLLGQTTGADSLYMELRKVPLPSGKGMLGFSIKVYRNHPRGHNIPYISDIRYEGNLHDTTEVQKFVLKL
jgi:hypothetical protein